jgi:tetratricopeptide (TPR) repeat protein
MTTFRWLHLTDLHVGMPGQASLWPNMEEIFLKDLAYLREQVGPWDLVLFTGDLTQCGAKSEFDELDRLLQRFWDRFKEWGFTPEFFAVPGNHDLVRPANTSDPALITLLHNWSLSDVQNPFWDDAASPQRALVTRAFQHFTDWWERTVIPKPAKLQCGLLPGDCAATVKAGTYKLGLVGLNSAFLQLGKGDFEGKLHLDVRQLHTACCGNGADWTRQHDLCLLLTHHPVQWLHVNGQKHFADEIHAPPERFALHFFGHMHEGNLSFFSHGGGIERRRLQGASLFGLESWGEEEQKREHGYSLCELRWEDDKVRFRVWPRRVKELQGGGWKFSRDDSSDLDERDGGTRPVTVKRLERDRVAAPVPPRLEPPPPEPAVSYDPSNPPFYVPYRQKGDQVVGRDAALAKVRKQLTDGRRTAIGQTALFQGLGGLGKTQLAVEYAYRFRGEYPNGIIWLTADQDLDAQLTDLAVKAHWVAPASDHHIKLEVALHRVRSYPDCLIIFDNLENLAAITSYLPELPAEPHILVTSRTEQPDFTYVPVELLDPDQSLHMLVQEAGRQPENEKDWAAAREIACRLDGLPLALELAGAYLARRPVSWGDYLDLLRHSLRKAMPPRLASLTEHESDLYSTLQVSESVIAEEPRLHEVLDVLTWSGPAAMGRELLAALIGAEDQGELIGALGMGIALRILQQEQGTDRYSLHRLVREVRREQAPLSERADWAADLCRRVADRFEVLREDFMQLTRFEVEVDHLREWHDHALLFAPKEASRLTWLQAYPPFHQGRLKEVRRVVELALVEYEQQACEERGLLAHLQNDLAYALHNFGETKKALELAEKVLAIRRELFGERHPDVATSLNNVASYTDALGDPKKALELAEKALAIRRELFGERHPHVATSLNNVASYTGALGDPKKALELAEKALAIQRELFGERHPHVANSLNNVASYTNALGDPKKALELAEKALAIQRELFGERHPDVATSLNNVASYTNALGDPKKALELAEKALAIRRELFGERHPKVAMNLLNVAVCHKELGAMHRSYNYAQKSYEIFKHILGPQHQSTQRCKMFLEGIRRPGFRAAAGRKGAGKRKKGKGGR